MPRCDCQGGLCSCVIISGEGAEVTGGGTSTNPYIVSMAGDLIQRITVVDTDTVDMEANGAGTVSDPLILSSHAKISMDGLTDVTAPAPALGDSLVWDGSQWVSQPPAVVPPGTVNVGPGLIGTGAIETPLAAATSGVWGTPPLTGDDSTAGLAIYVDVNGQLRAEPRRSVPVDWETEVSGKWSSFPTTWDDVAGKPTAWPVTASTNFMTALSGWRIEYEQGHLRGGVATVTFRVLRTGSSITVPANGNIPDQHVATVTRADFRPRWYGALTTTVGEYLAMASINPDGRISIGSVVPGVVIRSGDTQFTLTGTWITQA